MAQYSAFETRTKGGPVGLELFGTLEAIGARQAPPDPEILKAIGLGHDLESAVADLVDNSLDAGASFIQIRFVVLGGLVREFLVVEDRKSVV